MRFYEKVDGLSTTRTFSASNSPRNNNVGNISRAFQQNRPLYKATVLLKTQFCEFQEMIINTGFKSLRLGTDVILNQSLDGGGMHVSNVGEFEALVLPFGLVTIDQKNDDHNNPGDNENKINTDDKKQEDLNLLSNIKSCKRTNDLEFPIILPFSKRLSEFAILLQQFHFDIFGFNFNRNIINQNLTLSLWDATFKIFDYIYLDFKSFFRNAKNRIENSLSLISQSSIDADHFSKLIKHFFCNNHKLPDFNLMKQKEYNKKVSKNTNANDSKSMVAVKARIVKAKELSSKLERKIHDFKVLSSNLQDELVQILCEKTKQLTNDVLSNINLNAKHRSNSVLSEFRVLIDFLATSYVNLMNLPKAKRDSALYLSIAHVKSSMLDKLMPYLEGADDNIKVSMPGIFNITLAITSLENFAMEQGVEDLEQIFIPVRELVKDLENNLRS